MPVVYNRLPKIAAAARSTAAKAVAKAAFDCEALSKFNAPVDTGFLRNSIAAEQQGQLVWRVYANAEYALYVEVGTSRMGGSFYLTNALREATKPLNGLARELLS